MGGCAIDGDGPWACGGGRDSAFSTVFGRFSRAMLSNLSFCHNVLPSLVLLPQRAEGRGGGDGGAMAGRALGGGTTVQD